MSSIPPQVPATTGKGVWIAVFVMGAVIVALLSAVLYKLSDSSGNKPEVAAAVASQPASAPLAHTAAASSVVSALAAAPASKPAEQVTPEPAPQPAVKQRVVAPRPVPVAQQTHSAQQMAPQTFEPQQFAPQAAPAPAAPQQPVCNNCGTVTAVTPVQVQSQQTNPVGVIAGGLIGGILGNQVGGGDGRKLATVAGAIGGGIAGNEIAKRVDAQTVYNVQVRLDNGQVQTLQLKVAPPVGQRVQIGADGGLNPIR